MIFQTILLEHFVYFSCLYIYLMSRTSLDGVSEINWMNRLDLHMESNFKYETWFQVTHVDPTLPKSEMAHFSRPGSAYVIKAQPLHGNSSGDTNMAMASMTGDVLAGLPEEPDTTSSRTPHVHLAMFNNFWVILHQQMND